MEHDQGRMVIREAARDDARQIAEILVEDWKTAYRGIIDSAFLDAMSVEERYQREVQRYRQYRVAARGKEILGFTWNETGDDEALTRTSTTEFRESMTGISFQERRKLLL